MRWEGGEGEQMGGEGGEGRVMRWEGGEGEEMGGQEGRVMRWEGRVMRWEGRRGE